MYDFGAQAINYFAHEEHPSALCFRWARLFLFRTPRQRPEHPSEELPTAVLSRCKCARPAKIVWLAQCADADELNIFAAAPCDQIVSPDCDVALWAAGDILT